MCLNPTERDYAFLRLKSVLPKFQFLGLMYEFHFLFFLSSGFFLCRFSSSFCCCCLYSLLSVFVLVCFLLFPSLRTDIFIFIFYTITICFVPGSLGLLLSRSLPLFSRLSVCLLLLSSLSLLSDNIKTNRLIAFIFHIPVSVCPSVSVYYQIKSTNVFSVH